MYKSPKRLKTARRIAKVRELIGDTQKQFARRIGVKYSTVVQVENVNRPLTQRVADLILQATTIHPHWLFGDIGSNNRPLNIANAPITNPEDAKVGLQEKANPLDALSPLELRMIKDECELLDAFLKAAAGKGRFLVARYYLREAMSKTASSLGLKTPQVKVPSVKRQKSSPSSARRRKARSASKRVRLLVSLVRGSARK